MRTASNEVVSPQMAVRTVDCAEHRVAWSAPEEATAAHLVLVRRGRFRLESRGRRMTIDPTCGYLHVPGHEARFSHPAGGDICTSITLKRPALFDGLHAAAGVSAVRVDARLELAHRVLLRSCGDLDFAAVESVVNLLELARRREPDALPAPGRYELADRAREVILAGEPASTSLVGLASRLETSPSHLSRTFRHHVGMSISRYRNRVRVSHALQRIDGGWTDLASLAIALGFSDQAHFTRVMRHELGHPPGRLLAALRAAEPSYASSTKAHEHDGVAADLLRRLRERQVELGDEDVLTLPAERA